MAAVTTNDEQIAEKSRRKVPEKVFIVQTYLNEHEKLAWTEHDISLGEKQ